MVEFAVKILGDDFVPQIGVIGGGIAGEVTERGELVIADDRSVGHEAFEFSGEDFFDLRGIGRGVVEIERHRGVDELDAGPKATAESVGAIGAGDELGGNGFVGLVVAGEGGQHLRVVHPLFQHLRRGFDKIAF